MPHRDYQPFSCSVETDGDVVRILPVGELDLATVPEVDEQLRRAREGGFRRAVLDLRGVSFLDSSGLRLILSHQSASERNGLRFTVIRGAPPVMRVFEISGVLDRIRFEPPESSS